MSKRRRTEYNNHHRREVSNGGTWHCPANNISRVPVYKHNAYNTLFQVRTPQAIAKDLTDTWIDPDWVMLAVPRKKVHKLQQLLRESL